MNTRTRSLLAAILCAVSLIAAILLAGVAAEQAIAKAPVHRCANQVAEDDPRWDWTCMGNGFRAVITGSGKFRVVSAHRFCLLAKRGNLDNSTPRLRGDRWAIRNAC